jgi:outer membrane protein OmpA-like peptidoglycan-associated protein
MGKSVVVMGMVAVTLAVAPACATKGFVRESVGEVNEKVSTMGTSLEGTQERVRKNEADISDVDKRAQAAAQEARQAANDAAATADEVGEAAARRADAIEAANRKLLFEVVVSEDQGRFTFGGTELPDGAKTAIDDMVTRLKDRTESVWIEIEGYTDSTGAASYNKELGLERAEAVKRYLYEQHHVPLHKMNVISFGEEHPTAPNNTREGRAQNRRVVIKVLA